MHERVSRGFSLVELIVAMLLLGILAVSLWQRAPGRESLTLLGRAEQLASDIRYAQTLSMTSGERHCLALEPSSGPPYTGYTLRKDAACTTLVEQAVGARQPVSVCFASACVTTVGVASDELQFDGLGTPHSPAGTVLTALAAIRLSDAGGTRTVTVSPQTGRVRVQ